MCSTEPKTLILKISGTAGDQLSEGFISSSHHTSQQSQRKSLMHKLRPQSRRKVCHYKAHQNSPNFISKLNVVSPGVIPLQLCKHSCRWQFLPHLLQCLERQRLIKRLCDVTSWFRVQSCINISIWSMLSEHGVHCRSRLFLDLEKEHLQAGRAHASFEYSTSEEFE